MSAGLKPTLVIRFHSVNFYLNPIPANKEAPGNALECQPSGARESVSRTFRPTVLFAHMLLSIRLGLGSALAATRAACQEGRSPRFKGLSRHCQEPIPGPAGFGCILGRISRRCSSITPTGQSKENNRNCPLGHLDHWKSETCAPAEGRTEPAGSGAPTLRAGGNRAEPRTGVAYRGRNAPAWPTS